MSLVNIANIDKGPCLGNLFIIVSVRMVGSRASCRDRVRERENREVESQSSSKIHFLWALGGYLLHTPRNRLLIYSRCACIAMFKLFLFELGSLDACADHRCRAIQECPCSCYWAPSFPLHYNRLTLSSPEAHLDCLIVSRGFWALIAQLSGASKARGPGQT